MIYILIPVYNEQANILNLYNELSEVLLNESKFFVFCDDGSSDNTVVEIQNLFKDLNFILLKNTVNKGPGYSFNKGFEWILNNSKSDSDIVVTMEADCTSDIKILPTMVSISRLGYDLVLASVYAQGGGFDKTTFTRRFLSAVANLFFRYVFDIKTLTLTSFYRVYSIKILKKIKEKYSTIIEEKGFICMLEILLKAIRVNASIIEVPMKLVSGKRKDKSKMKKLKTLKEYIIFLLKQKINAK